MQSCEIGTTYLFAVQMMGCDQDFRRMKKELPISFAKRLENKTGRYLTFQQFDMNKFLKKRSGKRC